MIGSRTGVAGSCGESTRGSDPRTCDPPIIFLATISRDIAELLGCRHDNVKTTIERLTERGLVSFTATQETSHTGPGARPVQVYNVGKRDSYIIVAQLSPEFTARLVDRWQELEESSRPALPDFGRAGLLSRWRPD